MSQYDTTVLHSRTRHITHKNNKSVMSQNEISHITQANAPCHTRERLTSQCDPIMLHPRLLAMCVELYEWKYVRLYTRESAHAALPSTLHTIHILFPNSNQKKLFVSTLCIVHRIVHEYIYIYMYIYIYIYIYIYTLIYT